MVALKLMPHILSWAAIVLILLRGFSERRPVVIKTSITGFVIGVTGTFLLFRSFPGTIPFGIIKTALGVGFLFLWFFSVAAIYNSAGRGVTVFRGERFFYSSLCTGAVSGLVAMVAGAVCSCRLPAVDSSAVIIVLLALATSALAYALAYTSLLVEKCFPASFKVTPLGLLASVVSLLLFSSSSLPRLDLFSPLSMKVMKGVHDFVHQFMESVLIPDHLFVKPVVWKYIGFLFGKEVGFWGGMIIWFAPALLILLVVGSRRLPSVAHIRQGAQRRKLLSVALVNQRRQLFMPLFSMVIFAAAAYQSSFPSVEYWDPKPLPVTANQGGEIIIPKKGDINLEDGKLHKYLFKQGEQEARFFVLLTPEGQLTVDLDACAICKPDGYGQAEGSVICYYCKTLIPLETVGKPGGCNPVPVAFSVKEDSVVIDGMTLINSWGTTVQATSRVKEGGR